MRIIQVNNYFKKSIILQLLFMCTRCIFSPEKPSLNIGLIIGVTFSVVLTACICIIVTIAICIWRGNELLTELLEEISKIV